MKFSIITVCFNAANTIKDTIKSVEDQTYHDVEHIVIDGGSSDGTAEIVRRNSSRISKFISEPDAGIYHAMNKGLSMASGEVIGFLNADDFYANANVLALAADELKKSGIDACYTDLIYVRKNDISKIVRYWKSCDFNESLYERGWCPPHLTFFARKEVYEKYGNFDTSFKLASDFEILLRFLCVEKIKSHYLPFVSVKMRMGGTTNQSIKNVVKQNVEIIKAYRKHKVNISIPLFFIYKIYDRAMQAANRR